MPIVPYLIADTFGSHIGKYSQRLKITQGKTVLQQAPLLHLKAVHIVSRGVSISSDAVEACVEQGIPIYFMTEGGHSYASLFATQLGATIKTRREQLRAYDDERAVVLAKGFVVGKITNQVEVLYYLSRKRDEDMTRALQAQAHTMMTYLPDIEALPMQSIEALREHLMGIEGITTRHYWQAVRALIPEHYGWQQRTGRGANDPINSLLNYGYGILYSEVERAIILAGLDPYAGYLHADRAGKPSLVLDAIEEFRAVVVDRVVWGLAGRQFNVEQDERGMMLEETRRRYAEHILNHLDAPVKVGDAMHPLRHLLQRQMRRIAQFLRGERRGYAPFKMPAL